MKKKHDASAASRVIFFSVAARCWWAFMRFAMPLNWRFPSKNSMTSPSEVGGEPIELVQTKHHIGKRGNLSDASSDL